MASIFDMAEESEPMPEDEASEGDGMEQMADEMIAALKMGDSAALASILRSIKGS